LVARVRLERVSKRYRPTDSPAVEDLSLTLDEAEILVLLGPSGCGKTTTLRLIAGFEVPDSGLVEIGGRLVAGRGVFLPPERRGVGIVFQEEALFPHLTVAENIAFGLRSLRGRSRQQRIWEMIEAMGLGPYALRYPHELSGGQRQRVALARALAPRPSILLLDEPLASLDACLREELLVEIKRFQRELSVTTLYITHDQAEALKVADRLAVMRQGRLVQVGSPEEVYRSPRDRFVASFLGSATVVEGLCQQGWVETPLGRFPLERAEGKVALAFMPDQVKIDPQGPLRGRLVEKMFLGRQGESYIVDVGGLRLRCQELSNGLKPLRVGDEVSLRVLEPPLVLED
jgi:iron(III) transport system ATP-binding protein